MDAETLSKMMQQKVEGSSGVLGATKDAAKEKNSILLLHPDQIVLDPNQVRKVFDEQKLQELASTIEGRGQKEPVQVIPLGNNKYKLKFGERRYRAITKYTNLDIIKAILYSGDEKGTRLDQYIENEQREGLNPFEIADAIKEIMEEYEFTKNVDAAKLMGKPVSYISKHKVLLDIPQEIKEDYYENKRTYGISVLYAIAKMDDDAKKVEAYFEYVNDKVDRAELEGKTVKPRKKPPSTKGMTQIEKTTNRVMRSFGISGTDKEDFQKELKKLIGKYKGKEI